MVHVVKGTVAAQRKHSSDIEQCLDSCKEKFNQILSGVLNEGNQDAHKMEASIYKQLMKLGFILMQTGYPLRSSCLRTNLIILISYGTGIRDLQKS